MKIAIRMDDITADMDWGRFLRFQSLLDAHGVRALLGVVPDPRDPALSIDPPREDFWFPLNHFSEFAGVPYAEQADLIRTGKEMLASHGIRTDLFMAPGHSFDRNTLTALRENGFTGLTDGFGTAPYEYCGLVFYPISFNRSSVIRKGGSGVTTFVVHADTMTDAEFAWYESILKKQDVISYAALREMPAKRAGAVRMVQNRMMAAAKHAAVRASELVRAGRKTGQGQTG